MFDIFNKDGTKIGELVPSQGSDGLGEFLIFLLFKIILFFALVIVPLISWFYIMIWSWEIPENEKFFAIAIGGISILFSLLITRIFINSEERFKLSFWLSLVIMCLIAYLVGDYHVFDADNSMFHKVYTSYSASVVPIFITVMLYKLFTKVKKN